MVKTSSAPGPRNETKKRSVLLFKGMQSRSGSRGDHKGFHLSLIAFVCLNLFISLSPTALSGTDGLTSINDQVGQIEALIVPGAPTVLLDNPLSEDLFEEVVELTELTDDDEIEHCLLRLDPAGFGSPKGRYESSADRSLALTLFRLRGFPTRGSPLA